MSSSDQPQSDPPSGSASRSRRAFFLNRFSTLSLASIKSNGEPLPQYSVTDSADTDDRPPNFDELSESTPGSLSPGNDVAHSPSRYSFIYPRHSTILGFTAPINTPPQPQAHEFHYTFPIRTNKPWAMLHLFTKESIPGNLNPSRTKPKVPTFWGGQLVQGVLKLDLASSLVVQHISITIKGKLITSFYEGDSHLFFTETFTLWDRTRGDPRTGSVLTTNEQGKFDEKLIGEYNFPFEFPFPTHVNLSKGGAVFAEGSVVAPFSLIPAPRTPTTPTVTTTDEKGKKRQSSRPWSSMFAPSPRNVTGGSEQVASGSPGRPMASSNTLSSTPEQHADTIGIACPLPQTFKAKGVGANVAYELTLHIVHGRFRPDSKIKTQITYTPALVPLPASLQRRQAYDAGAVLPGPASDPGGWFALPQTTFQGFFSEYDRRIVKADCTLFLAKPLSYTRGTVIPCYLVLSSDDVELLAALSSPKAPLVRLTRRIRYVGSQGTESGSSSLFPASHEALHDEALHEQSLSAYGTFQSTGIFAHDVWGGLMPSSPRSPHGKSRPGGDGDAVGSGSQCKETVTVIHEIATALWWVPPKDVRQERYVRCLEGEIHLGADLQPSCACTIFSVEYFVEILPFASSRFEPTTLGGTAGSSPAQGSLAAHPVEITTLAREDEPVPVAFTEPPKAKAPTVDVADEEPSYLVKVAGLTSHTYQTSLG